MNLRLPIAASVLLATFGLTEASVRAANCDVNNCTAQIQAAAGVVSNTIFTDKNGNDAQHLPVYGTLINNWPNCPEHVDFAGAGHSNPPYDCDGEYSTTSETPTVARANVYMSAVDRQWWQPCRLNNPTITNGCVADWTCIADGVGGNYNPWQGLVFDLGGPSNKVVIMAENDHGPQPCESLEYTVFLSDNPYAQDQVLDPKTTGVDPMKWNRAVLTNIYTQGWVVIRPPDPTGHASCGDTPEYSVEEDSFVQVFSLPCGITFRYASVVAGNDGRDFPACAYDSNEAELDAVAGLTESGAGVCPDNDHDGFVDCNCKGAPMPPLCDCNDMDPNTYPGAPEACDATTDYNCDGKKGTACPANQVCYKSVCEVTCAGGENPYCPPGSTCTVTPNNGNLCIPANCNCQAGQVCVNNQCVDPCKGVVCPGVQVCRNGACVDPCATIQCPAGQSCQGGLCKSPCNCFAGNIGCPQSGTTCDSGNTNTCVPPKCMGVSCPAGQTCDGNTGTCVGFCNPGVVCPSGQKCVAPTGCAPLCTGVTCTAPATCDPTTGTCVDSSCKNVTCLSPEVCMAGQCVLPGSGGTGGTMSAGMGGSSSSTSTSTSTSAGTGGAGGAGTGGAGGTSPGSKGKCGCRAAGDDDDLAGGALAVAMIGLAAALRRRRS